MGEKYSPPQAFLNASPNALTIASRPSPQPMVTNTAPVAAPQMQMAYAASMPSSSPAVYAVPAAGIPQTATAAYRSYSPPRAVTAPVVTSAPPIPVVAAPVLTTAVAAPVVAPQASTAPAVAAVASSAPVVTTQVAAPVRSLVYEAPPVQPVFFPQQMLPQQPRDVFVDRPYPVFQMNPVPMFCPAMVNHTFKNFYQQEDHDFPYHDPAYGTGWRYHSPDDVDEHWNDMSMYTKTPLQELLLRREEETWRDVWDEAHLGVSEHGWRHRPLPFSRRVVDPEHLIPHQRDFYTELLL